MPKKKHSTYIICTWHDSFSYGNRDWEENDEIDLDPLLIATVGIIIKENKKSVCVAVSAYSNRSCGIIEIPKGAIVQQKRLKFPFKYTK